MTSTQHIQQPADENKEPLSAEGRRMGVIYCPRPGGKRLWRKIKRCLNETEAEFDYFVSENSADVERLAAIMTRNGYDRIIVVGGDAALGYAVNGVMKTCNETGNKPALGVIPAGYGNDFAKYWGIEPADYRQTVKGLMAGRMRRIDVGRCNVTENGETRTEYFVNCVNIGVAASIMNLRHLTFSVLGLRTVSYFVSSLVLLFSRMSYRMALTTSGERFERRAMTLCVGSARGYGQTPSAVPYNGQLDISLVITSQLTQLVHGLYLLFTGRFLSHKGISVWRTRRVKFELTDYAPLSLDGRFVCAKAESLGVDIMQEAIDFLIVK